MTTEAERINGREMIAAAETAKRNPMRPPETLPRDGKTAWRVFLSHASPQLISVFIVIFGAWRLYYGHFTWVDALIAVAAVAYFPFNEWLIHVFMLHYKPRFVFGKKIDFYLPVTHRRHHADPWNLNWVFIPRHIHWMTIPIGVSIVALLWPWKEWALTYLTVYLILGLHYEWVHYLAHIPWCPQHGFLGSYYQRRVREHRYHHFRNENYWWGVSMGLGDRVLGTAPAVETTSRSGTTSTLGMNK